MLQAYLTQCTRVWFIGIHSTKEEEKTTQLVRCCKVLSIGAVTPQNMWVCAECSAHVQSCSAQLGMDICLQMSLSLTG